MGAKDRRSPYSSTTVLSPRVTTWFFSFSPPLDVHVPLPLTIIFATLVAKGLAGASLYALGDGSVSPQC